MTESCSVTAVGLKFWPFNKFLLGVDLHAPAKIHVNLLTVGMVTYLSGLSLSASRMASDGNKPDNRLCLGDGECVKNRANGVAGDKGLSTACGHLEAEVGNTGQNILIVPQSAVRTLFLPKAAESCRVVPCFIQQFQIAGQVRYDRFLIALSIPYSEHPLTVC